MKKEPPAWVKHARRLLQHGDRPWNALVISMALLVVALMLAIGVLLWRELFAS